MPLNTVAISPSSPSPSIGNRVPKSPSRTAVKPASSWRNSTWSVAAGVYLRAAEAAATVSVILVLRSGRFDADRHGGSRHVVPEGIVNK
ncbi:hypothetical protein NONI108955_37605 [Nocardia ninae]